MDPVPTSARTGAAGCTAIVLAGGGADDPVARAAGVAAKALVPIGGTPMVARVAAAVAAADGIDDVVCVGNADVAAAVRAAVARHAGSMRNDTSTGGAQGARPACVPAGRDFADSLALGIGAALGRGAGSLLIVTADLPWLERDAVDRFVRDAVRRAEEAGVELVYPVVSRAASERRFPGQRRTWVRLRTPGEASSGALSVTGGNLAWMTPRAAPGVVNLAGVAYRARKNPFALASVVGPEALVRIALGRLRLDRLEARIGAMIGVPVAAMICDDARLSADLDRPDRQLDDAAIAPPAGDSSG